MLQFFFILKRTPECRCRLGYREIKSFENSCISLPSKRAGWTSGNESKPDGKSIMWWMVITTNSRIEAFRLEDKQSASVSP